jgi:hypothetical protein
MIWGMVLVQMKMIWGIHDGQCLAYDEAFDRGTESPYDSSTHGLPPMP